MTVQDESIRTGARLEMSQSAQIHRRVMLPFSSAYYFPVLRIQDVIPDPDFYPSRISNPGSRIPYPKTETKVTVEKNIFVIPLL
jgi:hypothetical protein